MTTTTYNGPTAERLDAVAQSTTAAKPSNLVFGIARFLLWAMLALALLNFVFSAPSALTSNGSVFVLLFLGTGATLAVSFTALAVLSLLQRQTAAQEQQVALLRAALK
jgi:hypothetical protein